MADLGGFCNTWKLNNTNLIVLSCADLLMMAAFIRGSSVGQVLFNKFSCFQLKRGNMKNWYDILLDHCNELMSVIDKAYRGRPAVCLAFNVITIDSSSLHSKLQRISRDCKTNNVEDLLSVSKPQILYNCSHPILFCYDFVYIYSVCLMFFSIRSLAKWNQVFS